MEDQALSATADLRPRWLMLGNRQATAVLLLMTAVILRSGDFFNTIPGDDEQYYLLVAHHLLNGAVPYIDIWDRKPFGLFALLAGLLAFGGNPFLVTAIGATVAAAGTAYLITRIAQRHVGTLPSIGAGVFYLAMLELFGGDTIQTAVFYNLLVVGGVALLLNTSAALESASDRGRAATAMLLMGLALTIKTIAVFEVGAIGLWFVVRINRERGPVSAALWALGAAAIGIAPTAVIGAAYWFSGEFDAWWFANFVSQLRKTGGFDAVSFMRLPLMLPGMVLLTGVGVLGWKRTTANPDRMLLATWYLAGYVQVFVLGNFWALYALPLIAPTSVLGARLFAIPRRGILIFVALCISPLAKGIIFDRLDAAQRRQTTAEVMRWIPDDAATTCILGYDAPEIFYLLSNSCLISPYLFVDQFRSAAEAKALPVDASSALSQALARRPGTILTVRNVEWPQPNHANDRLIARAVARDYRRVAEVPWRTALNGELIIVWHRNDLPAR